jgi:hypothetical protein
MAGFLYKFPILIVGNRMDVDVISLQVDSAGRNFGHEDGILGSVEDEDLVELIFSDSLGEFARGDQDHFDRVDGGDDLRGKRRDPDQIRDGPEILFGHWIPLRNFLALLYPIEGGEQDKFCRANAEWGLGNSE